HVIRLYQPRIRALEYERTHRRPSFERRKERNVSARHIRAHRRQVRAELVLLMADTEHCVEARHDRALRAGFAVVGLRRARVLRYAFVRYRVLLPAMNEWSDARIVDLWFAAFR